MSDMLLPTSEASIKGSRDWPHAPPHRLGSSGVYFVTSRTTRGIHHLEKNERKDWFQEMFFSVVKQFNWKLEAWAILSNHYHFIAHSPNNNAETLKPMIQKIHSLSTKQLNHWDNLHGRTRIWHNYRETHITHQKSYLARLNYVHQNAVHHGLVHLASQWKWCSASSFKKSVTPAWLKTIASFHFDQIAKADGE